MQKRVLGTTGERLSVVGFGGIVVMNETAADAAAYVGRAIDRGINYFDVAPTYGNAEERLGPALAPYRQSVFLACKTTCRDAEGTVAELARSLQRLQTDHVDLYQCHGVTTLQEVGQILGPGGALEAMVKARRQGLLRYIGFSAHSEEAALALLDGFTFDSVLFPLNFICWHHDGFGRRVLAVATEKGVGVLALKALAMRAYNEGEARVWPKCWYVPVDSPELASVGLRFALSLPVTAAVCPGHAELLWWACDAAEQFTPLPAAEAESHARQIRGRAVFEAHP